MHNLLLICIIVMLIPVSVCIFLEFVMLFFELQKVKDN